jgi:methyltransferase
MRHAACSPTRGRSMTQSTPAQRMEQVIRRYIQACSDADANAIAACFVPEAVHYFPSRRKWVGAATIGNNFTKRVQEEGHCCTVDH